MLEIYLRTLIHSQLSNQLWDKIGLLILHVLILLICAFYTTLSQISLIDFRLWVFLGPDPIYMYYFGKSLPELATIVFVPYLTLLIICMIFLSPFLDAIRMSMSTASFLKKPHKARLCNSLPTQCFSLFSGLVIMTRLGAQGFQIEL